MSTKRINSSRTFRSAFTVYTIPTPYIALTIARHSAVTILTTSTQHCALTSHNTVHTVASTQQWRRHNSGHEGDWHR